MNLSQQDLNFDTNHIWHPYTNLLNPSPVFGVESADGVYLTLSNGQRVVDGMSSWWAAIHGYNHPQLNAAITDQLAKMSHVMFGGLTHEPAISLAKKLIEMTAEQLQCVFLADSGSVAVEVAIKMALQFWISQGRSEKHRMLAFKNGYHGDTFATMAVCDPVNGMHSMFKSVLQQHLFVEAPKCREDKDWQPQHIAEFEQVISNNHHQLAAVIIEPIVQGAGGMRMYCPEYLRQIRRLCDQYDVLLILDEIATGFGRTGTMFAYQQADIAPDILCVGKALTGGYLSLAATITTEKVAKIISQFESGALMHGPTFMGNPLACAVAVKSLNLLQQNDWQLQVAAIEQQLLKQLTPFLQFESVAEVRVKGAIGVVELKQPVDMHRIQPRLVELGVWIRPFGKLLYIMPPFIIQPEELTLLTEAIGTIAVELSAKDE